ncbi:hypothetical protein AB8A31_03900 [Tardiphaga sp. 804_B3_N1_9]|jgi:hypothetical protein|uniref:hypothetical protein n=1 Tax=Tardiphaga TaxID=1395974 RepID=UPI001586B340|nr:hypothetical protein [Tardiphaga robiniae]NUU41750.1 hypothetical protein [Tardiphaga robiniae]
MKNIVLILFLSQAADPGASRLIFGMVKMAGRHALRPASQGHPSPAITYAVLRRVPNKPCYGMFPAPDAERNPAL